MNPKTRIQVGLLMPRYLLDEARDVAQESDRSFSAFVRRAVRNEIERYDNPPAIPVRKLRAWRVGDIE